MSTGARADADVAACAEVIRDGGVAIVPTDTLYGLAASIRATKAVARVQAIKARPTGQGMPVLLASTEQVVQVGQTAPRFAELAAAFWPGRLTLVILAVPELDPVITDERGTVAVRVPDLRVTRELSRLVGVPLTGTSANPAGARPPVTVAEANVRLTERVDFVLDWGRVGGTASTIVDLTTDPPRLLRAGPVTRATLLQIVPELHTAPGGRTYP